MFVVSILSFLAPLSVVVLSTELYQLPFLHHDNMARKLLQACGVLRTIEPLNSFLASLCKFTINNPNEGEKRRYATGILFVRIIPHFSTGSSS